MRTFVCCFAVCLAISPTAALAQPSSAAAAPRTIRIFFIGTSSSPAAVRDTTAAFIEHLSGAKVEVQRPSGYINTGPRHLGRNIPTEKLGTPTRFEDVDLRLLKAARFDFVVLQVGLGNNPQEAVYYETYAPPLLEKFAEAAKAAGAKLVIYERHGYAAKVSDEEFARYHAFIVKLAKDVNAVLAPCGVAYRQIFKERGEAYLHTPKDKEHVTLDGYYLISACIASAITGQSPVVGTALQRISTDKYDAGGGLRPKDAKSANAGPPPQVYTDQEARLLQNAAWNAVQSTLESGDRKANAPRK